MRAKKELTEDKDELVLEARAEGMTWKQIAKIYNVSVSTMTKRYSSKRKK